MTNEVITVELVETNDVEWIRKKVREGHFASETEAVAGYISLLRKEEADFEVWLHEVVGPTHDRMLADPSRALSAEEVERRIEARGREFKKTA